MKLGDLVYSIVVDRRKFDQSLRDVDRDSQRLGTQAGRAYGVAVGNAVAGTNVSLSRPLNRTFTEAEGIARRGSSKLGAIVTGVFQGVGSTITQTMVSAVTASVGALAGLGKKMIEIGSNAENLQIAFRAIIGDAAKADKLLADLRKFSAETPFTGVQVQESAQRLLTTVKPEDMLDTLRRLGEVASGTKSDLGDLATIYSQVLSKQKFQAEEMLQFAEKGIPIQEAVAKVLGVQVKEVSKLGSEGKISGEIMVKAFAQMADKGGKFSGIMEKQSKTVAGLGSTMQDGFEASLKVVYDKLNPAILATLESINKASAAAGKQEGSLDLVAKAASNVENFLKKHQPEIDKASAAAARMATKGLSMMISGSEKVYTWLQKNPAVLEAMGMLAKNMGNTFNLIVDTVKLLAPAFGSVVNFIAEGVKLVASMLNKMQEVLKVTLQVVDATGLLRNPMDEAAGTSGSAVNGGRFTVKNPNGTSANSLSESTTHHSQHKYNDSPERTTKDFTIYQNGKSNVPVPSPVSGTVKTAENNPGGYGNYVVLTTAQNERVLLGHFEKLLVRAGDRVVRGQALGIQGSTGRSTGTHVHIEAPRKYLDPYYKSMATGQWGESQKQVAAIQNNPENVRGFLQALSSAESGGDRLARNPSSGARGKYQFLPSTRSEIMRKGAPDPWADSDQLQDAAAITYIKQIRPGAYNAILRGDFETAARELKGIWTSLPGGAEQGRQWKSQSINDYRPGGSRYKGGEGGGDPNSIGSSPAKNTAARFGKETMNSDAITVMTKKPDDSGMYRESDFMKVYLESKREKTADDDYWTQYNEWVQQQIENAKDKGGKITDAIAKLREKESAELEARATQNRLNEQKGVDIKDAIARATQERYDRRDETVNTQTSIFSSNMSLASSQADAMRDPDRRRSAQKAVAVDNIRLDLTGQLHQIEQLGRSGQYTSEQLDTMRLNAEKIAQIKIDGLNDQFMTLGQTITQTVGQAFGTFLNDVLLGTKSINESFGDMLRSIAGSVAQMGISRLIGGLFGGGVSAFAGGSGAGMKFGSLGQAWNYEKSVSGRQPKLAVINDGEIVLSSPQVDMLKANMAGIGLGGITGFSGGSFTARAGGGTNVSLGDINIGDSSPAGSEERLKKLIKNAVYSVIVKEQQQGGSLRR